MNLFARTALLIIWGGLMGLASASVKISFEIPTASPWNAVVGGGIVGGGVVAGIVVFNHLTRKRSSTSDDSN